MREPVNGDKKNFTYQTRLAVDDSTADFLQDFSELYGRVERSLYADYCKGKNILKLKSEYLTQFGISARHFNAVRINLQGKIDSVLALMSDKIDTVETQIKKNQKVIKQLSSKENLTQNQANKLHQKKRLVNNKILKLESLKQDKQQKRARICFGSKKLFKKQFYLQENNYPDHQAWRKDWQAARSSQFYLIGSKDETMGNQNCVALIDSNNSLSINIRVPKALEAKYGKHVKISHINFSYGFETIKQALVESQQRSRLSKKNMQALHGDLYKQHGRAINYRLLKDNKGWRLFVTCDKVTTAKVSDKRLGAIGVDINAGFLSVCETNHTGNPVKAFDIAVHTYGKNQNQAKAIIGDAVKQVIDLAIQTQKPLVIEKLDFSNKKKNLGSNKQRARLLSAFAYSQIIHMIKSRAFRFGVDVYEVNPAYSSVIGRVKFASRYPISVHQAAALTIARRLYDFSERLPRSLDNIPNHQGHRVTLPALAKMPGKHIWCSWAKVMKELKVVLAAQPQKYRAPDTQCALTRDECPF